MGQWLTENRGRYPGVDGQSHEKVGSLRREHVGGGSFSKAAKGRWSVETQAVKKRLSVLEDTRSIVMKPETVVCNGLGVAHAAEGFCHGKLKIRF